MGVDLKAPNHFDTSTSSARVNSQSSVGSEPVEDPVSHRPEVC